MISYVYSGGVQVFNPAADSTLGKRKIKEEVEEEEDSPPKAKKPKTSVAEDEGEESTPKKKKKKKKSKDADVEEPAEEPVEAEGKYSSASIDNLSQLHMPSYKPLPSSDKSKIFLKCFYFTSKIKQCFSQVSIFMLILGNY